MWHNGRLIEAPVNKREYCQRIHCICPVDGPYDFWSMGRNVPKSPEHALEEIRKALLFRLLGFRLERIQGQKRFLDGERLIDKG
jgi:hypothetical protein